MKAIMISIKPRWCFLIMNGDKTIEVRTSKSLASAIQKLIDKYGYADIYGYCSKSNYLGFISKRYVGKVNFKFRCYKVEEIIEDKALGFSPYFTTQTLLERILCKRSCLTPYDFYDYFKGKTGYAIHINDLEIFDPKELSEFYPYCKDEKCEYRNNHCSICYRKSLTKAPQSWCYIESED